MVFPAGIDGRRESANTLGVAVAALSCLTETPLSLCWWCRQDDDPIVLGAVR